jgi:hypothetical protein
MAEKIKGILFLCAVYRLITGEWPDLSAHDAQEAIAKSLEGKEYGQARMVAMEHVARCR